tara:strand:+ start:305 stop:469 length:165 start_codon:yes stop_codon:yes gene_type:complete
MKFKIDICERWKTEDGNWDFDELASEVYDNWDAAKRDILIYIAKGYLIEVKIIE